MVSTRHGSPRAPAAMISAERLKGRHLMYDGEIISAILKAGQQPAIRINYINRKACEERIYVEALKTQFHAPSPYT